LIFVDVSLGQIIYSLVETIDISGSKYDNELYLLANQASMITVVYTEIQNFIFTINCVADIAGHCKFKNVHIYPEFSTPNYDLKIVSFKNICWQMKQIGYELKFTVGKFSQDTVLIVTAFNFETLHEYPVGYVIIVKKDSILNSRLFIELETMQVLRYSKDKILHLKPVQWNLLSNGTNKISCLALQPESSVRPVSYKILGRAAGSLRYYKFKNSLVVLVSIDLYDEETFLVFCFRYFSTKNSHAFPQIVLEFVNEVIFIEK